ncbi:MAG: hypothetical protein IOD12_12805 [Silvanigrellales bacterium]|nr:hypothetical protein [Silvanigrellales bacterium]
METSHGLGAVRPFLKNEAGNLLLLACSGVWLAVSLAAALRHHLALAPDVATATAFMLTALLAALTWLRGLQFEAHFGSRALAFAALLFAIVLLSQWHRDWGPFVSTGRFAGGDAGNHIVLRDHFLNGKPSAYNGFTALYVSTWLLEYTTGMPPASSFAIALYAGLFIHVAVFASFLASGLSSIRSFSLRAALIAASVSALCVLTLVPFAYYQAEGFYAHLATLAPASLSLWFFCHCRVGLLGRCLAAGLAAVALRFTYGLNLADFLAALALTFAHVVIMEPKDGAQTWTRPFHTGVTLIALLGALAAYKALWPVAFDAGGGIRWTNMGPLDLAFLPLSLASFVLLAKGRMDFGLTLACSLGMVTGVVLLLHAAAGLPHLFYYFKYPFTPLAIVAGASPLFLARCLKLESLAWRTTSITLFLLVIGLGAWGYAPYLEFWTHRFTGDRSKRAIDRLVEPAIVAHIVATLEKQGRRFGGYYDPIWAYSHFMNSSLGNVEARRFAHLGHFRSGSYVTPTESTCSFWRDLGEANTLYAETDAVLAASVSARLSRLQTEAGVTCSSIRVSDSSFETLCTLCP